MEIRVDVESEDLLTGERRHTSTAFVTFVALDPVTRRPTAVPPLMLETEEERAEHARAQERRARSAWPSVARLRDMSGAPHLGRSTGSIASGRRRRR